MKKLVGSLLLCAASSVFASNADSATSQLNAGLTAATTNAAPAATTTNAPVGYESKTTSTISIAPRDNLIVATAITNWDPKASDTLAIQWVAPKGSYCQNSTFSVTRGANASHDTFWAYRTVVHTNSKGATVYCSGHWEAKVVNTADNNKVLATTGYDVAAPVSAVDTNAPSVSSPSGQ